MALSFTPTNPEELEQVRSFLSSAFRMPESAPFLEPKLMDWKYFAARGDGWEGPRSYVLRQETRIVAHGCAHPVTFVTCNGEVASTRVIDWGAAPNVPGVGVLLFRKFAGLAETLLAVGGSEQTQALLPKMGFRVAGELSLYARPLRPWLQYRTRPERGLGAAARLVRNLRWSKRSGFEIPAGWSAERVDDLRGARFPKPNTRMTVARRTPELLAYILRCPAAEWSAFLLKKREDVRGYFVLSRAGGQTRIADIWVEPTDAWPVAYALALQAVLADPAAAELKAVASTDAQRRAIEANGFIPRGTDPVFLYDPKQRLEGAPPLKLELLDGDECYLWDPSYPYLT